MTVHIALAIQRKSVKRAAGVHEESMRDALTEDLVRRIMGAPESEAVVLVPDLVGDPLSPRHGKWDIDEPHPHPELAAEDR